MGAPAGNQFWRMRAKHGRDRIFTDPDILLKSCYEYFDFQSRQSWVKQEAVKSGEFTGQLISIPTASPFSVKGLCVFLGVHSKYLDEFENNLKPKENDLDKDFSNIITHVRDVIFTQKSEGATVGVYNASIVARELGISDKVSNEITGKNGGPIQSETKVITGIRDE